MIISLIEELETNNYNLDERKGEIYKFAKKGTTEAVDELINVYNYYDGMMTKKFSVEGLMLANNENADKFLKKIGYSTKEIRSFRKEENHCSISKEDVNEKINRKIKEEYG